MNNIYQILSWHINCFETTYSGMGSSWMHCFASQRRIYNNGRTHKNTEGTKEASVHQAGVG